MRTLLAAMVIVLIGLTFDGSVSAAAPSGPAGYTFCANEDQPCSFSGPTSVAYGANGEFKYLNLTGGTACTNAVFGDPLVGTIKACYIQASAVTPPVPIPMQIPTSAPASSISAYSLSVPVTSVNAGANVTVTWSAPSGSLAKDWIGLFKTGDSNNNFIGGKWTYTNGAAAGSYTTSIPTTGGVYEFRYLENNGFTDVARSSAITGTVASAAPAVPTSPYSLSVPVTSVNAGANVTVTWSAPSGSLAKDWIGLFKTGDSNNNFIGGKWTYTNGAAAGSYTTSIPTTGGTYEFRYLGNNGFTDVARSSAITGMVASAAPVPTPVAPTPTPPAVPTSPYSLSVPVASVSGGGTVTATWNVPTGSSNKDWVGLYKVGDSNNSFIAGKWTHTNGAAAGSYTTTVPAAGGTYEFRYLLNDGYTDVTRSKAITVVGTTLAATPTPIPQAMPSPTPLPTGVGTFYLATNGSDSSNGLSLSTAWRTLQYALASIGTNGAGKTLIIRGGEYDTINGLRTDSNRDTLIPTGTSWSTPFSMQAYPGETVTFVRGLNPGATVTIAQMQNKVPGACGGQDCLGAPTFEECAAIGLGGGYPGACWSGSGNNNGSTASGWYLRMDRTGNNLTPALIDASAGYEHLVRYVIFDGIVFDGRGINGNILANTTTYGKELTQKHFRFKNGEWKNSAGSCMAQPGIGGEWEYDSQGQLHENEFEFLHFKIHHCGIPFNTYVVPGTGINAREHPAAKFLHGWYMHSGGNTCDDCELYKNAGTGVGPDGPNNIVRNSYIHDNACIGVQVGGGLHHQVYNNVFYNNGCIEMQLLSIGNSVPAGMGHKIYNNTLIAGPRSDTNALLIYNGFHGSTIENNIIDGYQIGIENQACGISNGVCVYTNANVVRNNLIRTVPAGKEITNTGTPVVVPMLSGNVLNQDPRFVNRAALDFRLQASSPALNAGANNGLTTDRSGKGRSDGIMDIGAHEFGN